MKLLPCIISWGMLVACDYKAERGAPLPTDQSMNARELPLDASSTTPDVEIVRQFDEKFPDAIHAVLHPAPNSRNWMAKALIFGRYVLVLNVPVQPGANGTYTQAAGDVTFLLVEVEKVEDGRTITYTDNQKRFDISDWNRLLKANMDFSAIGYHMEKDKPVEGLSAVLDAA